MYGFQNANYGKKLQHFRLAMSEKKLGFNTASNADSKVFLHF